jgi:hypothetical protein
VTPTNGQVVYGGGGGNGEGLFKSVDAGGSWQRVGAPIGDAPGWSIAIDPIVTTNLVMAMNSIRDGAARSVDAGATWEELHFPARPGTFRHAIGDVTLDPHQPHIIIGSASEYGLVEFEVSPDLEVVVASAPATLGLGSTGTATIRVWNRGPLAASAVRLGLPTLPEGPAVAAATPAQGSCARVNSLLTCTLGAIRVSQTVDTTLTLTALDTPSSADLVATVDAHESDPVLANNSATLSVATSRVANLGLTLARDAAQVDQGAGVVLTATATNQGPNASEVTQIAVTLGTGLTFRGSATTQGTCASNGNVVTCNVGRIDSGAEVVATVEAAATAVGALTAMATITDTALDPNAANNAADVTLTSRAVAESTTVEAPPSNSGGGGRTSLFELALLVASLGASQAMRKQARRHG